jgi:hypothetical protein
MRGMKGWESQISSTALGGFRNKDTDRNSEVLSSLDRRLFKLIYNAYITGLEKRRAETQCASGILVDV